MKHPIPHRRNKNSFAKETVEILSTTTKLFQPKIYVPIDLLSVLKYIELTKKK